MVLVQGRPLILYAAFLERSLGYMLAQNNDEGKEMSCVISAKQW